MPHALIIDGRVVQLDLSGNPPSGYVEVPHHVQPGFTVVGGEFISPAPTEPEPVNYLLDPMDRLTFWLTAAEVNVSRRSVTAHIELMEDSVRKLQAFAYVEEAQVYRRYDPFLIEFSAAAGITEEQLDALWVWALTPQ